MTFSSRYTVFIAFFLFLVQSSISSQTPINEAIRTVDIPPAWPGCDPKKPDCTKSKLASFISSNLKLPAEAKAEGAGGLVAVEFVVEKNGSVGEVRYLHDPGYGLGDEAIRVIKLMTTEKIKWSPALKKGKKVAYRYNTPVPFSLNAPPKETSKTEPSTPASIVYDVAEVMPRFAGCDQITTDTVDCTFTQMIKHIKKNLQYPREALAVSAQGPVVVDFIIDATGQVANPVVIKGLGYGLDEEAIRIISLMPKWIPGMQDGIPVAVKMSIPIIFQMPKEKD